MRLSILIPTASIRHIPFVVTKLPKTYSLVTVEQ